MLRVCLAIMYIFCDTIPSYVHDMEVKTDIIFDVNLCSVRAESAEVLL